MRNNLLLAALTAVILAGAPVLATAQTQELPGPDEEGFVDPDANGESSGPTDTDREGGDSVDRDEPSDPGGGTGGDNGGTD